jgi:hypothetical protein
MRINLAFGIAVSGTFLSLALFRIRHRIRQFLEAFRFGQKSILLIRNAYAVISTSVHGAELKFFGNPSILR